MNQPRPDFAHRARQLEIKPRFPDMQMRVRKVGLPRLRATFMRGCLNGVLQRPDVDLGTILT